jgi:sugar phosphate isomerase/epimerase
MAAPALNMQLENGLDLTYCTNIHPGNGWKEVFAQIRTYAPVVKRRLSPEAPFALGLRLSDEESRELRQEAALDEFAAFLQENGLYVALINGFPFGGFHRQKVKEDVFAPDWQTEERVEYTLRLIAILNRLLPRGQDGGVSTIPLSYKRWGADPAVVTRNLLRAVDEMQRIYAETGGLIHLDIEPEPDGMIENTAEVVRYFEDWLFPAGGDAARRHVRLCFDTCHMAVEYEDFEQSINRFADAGIQIGRVQISSALRIGLADGDRAQFGRDLEPFAESTYLHQVIERRENGPARQYPDLPAALSHIHEQAAAEWRIHFHVPIFVERYGEFGSTQPQIRTALEIMKRRRFSPHLEIETYTWDVLPPAMKQDLADSIVREYQWVLDAWR